MMNSDIQTQLLSLFQAYKALYSESAMALPYVDYDPEWRSPCEVGEVVDGKIAWQARQRDEVIDFNNIENALDIKLHPSIIDFYGSIYSAGLPCEFDGHPIELVQVWNEQELSLLQENMIAHFVMQQRLNKPASMFIATCSDEMQIISIINETGQVQLETLGKGQEAILAENLSEFLSQLRARKDDENE